MKDKQIYCKYCGLELERGACTCDDFLNPKRKKSIAKKKCDTCKKEIDKESNFCPYCGVPQKEKNDIVELQKELKGDFSEDCLADYKEEKRIQRKEKIDEILTPNTKIVIKVLVCVVVILFLIKGIMIIKEKIDDYNTKKYLESMEVETEEETTTKARETINIDETEQPVIKPRENWIRKDGYFYCLDMNGDPVIDDWVDETTEWGDIKSYYFDIDGRLVVNSWIDGEYYVGSDGARYRDRKTPDGAYVDEEGRIVEDEENAVFVPVERDMRVYYEAPDPLSMEKTANQRSSIEGIIKGVDADKTYELYIKSLKKVHDSYETNGNKCNVTFYYPVIAGGKEKEVNKINELIEELVSDKFPKLLRGNGDMGNKSPKRILLNTVDQRKVSPNQFIFIISGKVVPQSGFAEKKKYRFIYDRKAKKIDMLDISE